MIYTIGDEVEFTTTGDRDVTLPKRLWMVNDRHGEILERCWVFILPARRTTADVSSDKQSWAEDYYGEHADIFDVSFFLPKGPFRRLYDVKEIRYRRGATAEFFHPFEFGSAVTVYQSTSDKSYRLNLPDGCLINDRGFIRP